MAGARTGSSAVVSVAEQTSQQTQWLRGLEPAEPIFEAYPQQYTQTSAPCARSGKKKTLAGTWLSECLAGRTCTFTRSR